MSDYSGNMLHHQIRFPHDGKLSRTDRKMDGQALIPQLDCDLHKCCSVMEPRPARDNQDKILSAHLLARRRSAACHFQHRPFRPETARTTCPSGSAWIQHKSSRNAGGIRGKRENRWNSSRQKHDGASAGCASPPVLTAYIMLFLSCVKAPHAAPFLWQRRGDPSPLTFSVDCEKCGPPTALYADTG